MRSGGEARPFAEHLMTAVNRIVDGAPEPWARACDISSWQDRIEHIRRYYRAYEAAHGTDYGGFDPYEAGLYELMTPIELLVWHDIRASAGPTMVMQYPVGPFLLDFADPVERIAIEADGRDFHDHVRDVRRDTRLWREFGWKVYRIPGSECNRDLPSPESFAADYHEQFDREPDEDELIEAAQAYFMSTSAGVVRSVREIEIGRDGGGRWSDAMRESLRLHRYVDYGIA